MKRHAAVAAASLAALAVVTGLAYALRPRAILASVPYQLV
jgi:hypothetical protein